MSYSRRKGISVPCAGSWDWRRLWWILQRLVICWCRHVASLCPNWPQYSTSRPETPFRSSSRLVSKLCTPRSRKGGRVSISEAAISESTNRRRVKVRSWREPISKPMSKSTWRRKSVTRSNLYQIIRRGRETRLWHCQPQDESSLRFARAPSCAWLEETETDAGRCRGCASVGKTLSRSDIARKSRDGVNTCTIT